MQDNPQYDPQSLPQTIPQPPMAGMLPGGPVPGEPMPLQMPVPAQPPVLAGPMYGGNPLQNALQNPAPVPGAIPPLPAGSTMPAYAAPAQRSPSELANSQLSDNDPVPVDDIVWVNRAKRILIETHGDPFRQVQLIQHLRATYLKERFGRNIHTDDGLEDKGKQA